MRHQGLWSPRWLLAGMLALSPALLSAQDRQVTGRVTRAPEGTAIAGAEVSVVGSPGTRPVRSGEDGRFTISVPGGEIRLMVRAIGFTALQVPVPSGQSSVDVSMSADVFKLSEVVVTGQATTVERRNATTSVGYVSGDDISKVAAPTIESALSTRVPGLNLQSNSGAPGGGVQLQIRGNATILGASDPLVVVDGVIYSNDRIPSRRSNAIAAVNVNEDDAVNRLADLNPADIQSIEILKGAAASSIYGSKAANGVILVQTIRGTAGAPRVNVSQRLGTFDLSNSIESRCYTLEAAVARFGPTANDYATNGSLPCYNHYEQLFGRKSLSYETVADVSGGTDATRYFVSGTWKKDEGIAANTGFDRQALRLNVDQRISSKLDVKVSSAFNRSAARRGWTNNSNNYGGAGYAFAYIPSYIDLRRAADGSYPLPTGSGVPNSNPVQTYDLATNDEEAYRFTGGATLTWQAVSSGSNLLSLIASAGADAFQQKNRIHTPNELYFEATQNTPGTSIDGNGFSRNLNYNLNALWSYAPGSSWSSSLSGGVQYEDRRLRVTSLTTTNLVPGQGNTNQGTNFAPTDSLGQERTFALYVNEELRLLDDRLTILGGLRAERSSANGNVDKFYIFPRVSGAYRLGLLGEGNDLKIRGAFGIIGNQPLFGQKFTLLNTPQLGGANGFTVAGAAGAPDIEPERLKEYEVGLDASLAQGRVVLEATYYNRKTENLFLNRVPAPSSGFTNQLFNGGTIGNQGVELGLGVTPVQARTFQWVTRANFALNRSKVLDLPVASFRPPNSGFGGLGVTFIEEGKSLTQIIGFAFDENGNRTATQVALGDSRPDFRIGFSNDFTWKSLNISAALDYQKGGSIINLTQFLYDDAGTAGDFGSDAHAERVAAQAAGVMTPYIEDASFLKLRELSIGYQLPRSFVSSLGFGVRDARISITGRNLLTWDKYTGLDAEVANFGSSAIRGNLDIAPFPPSRSVFFNLAFGF